MKGFALKNLQLEREPEKSTGSHNTAGKMLSTSMGIYRSSSHTCGGWWGGRKASGRKGHLSGDETDAQRLTQPGEDGGVRTPGDVSR